MTASIVLQGEMTLRAVLRRRLTLGILVAMPVAFYMASHDSIGRAVRALGFGLSWAVSTVAFFAAVAATDLEPRLRLAGWKSKDLLFGRILGLGLLGSVLSVIFGVLIAVDQDPMNSVGVFVGFAVTAAVAIAIGTTVGAISDKEMEGTLILFFLAGLQAVVNPFDSFSRVLPFWSSRELGTWAIDGPDVGSLADGLFHAAATLAICAGITFVVSKRRGA